MIVRDMNINDVQDIIKKDDIFRVYDDIYQFIEFVPCEYAKAEMFSCRIYGCKGLFKVLDVNNEINNDCFCSVGKCLIDEIIDDFIEGNEFSI